MNSVSPSSELLKLKVVLGTPKLTIDVTSKGGLVNCSLTSQLVSEMRAVLETVTPSPHMGLFMKEKKFLGTTSVFNYVFHVYNILQALNIALL